jgi:hypothetical protein
VQGRAAERGDDADRQRKRRQARLAAESNRPSAVEQRLQPEESLVERARAAALHRLDHELQLAARLVHRQRPRSSTASPSFGSQPASCAARRNMAQRKRGTPSGP